MRVAVMPFENASAEPMAGRAAREALYYTLAEKGFDVIPYAAVDEKLADPAIRSRLCQADGSVNAAGVRALFGAHALATGRVLQARQRDLGPVVLARLQLQVWLIDTQTQAPLWYDRAGAIVRVPDPPSRGPNLTPAERKQAHALRLCQAFDRLWQHLARSLPAPVPPPAESAPAIDKLVARGNRPVVPAGESVSFLVTGAPEAGAVVGIGMLGTSVTLSERPTAGRYTGSYTIRPDDYSHYCRIGAILTAPGGVRRKFADPRAAFLIDTAAPEAPTSLTFATQPGKVALAWAPPVSGDVAHYLVYRSLDSEAGMRLLGRPEAAAFVDETAQGPARYAYIVKSVDLAGNPSVSAAELEVELPKAGPTEVGGAIAGEARWTACGSPYSLTEAVEVTTGARLLIEPGVRIDIPAGLGVVVRGKVEAIGTEAAPITIAGPGEKAACGFRLVGPQARLILSNAVISGAGRGIEAAAGACRLEKVVLNGNSIGLESRPGARVALTECRVEQNQTGAILAAPFEVRRCAFLDNQIGLRLKGDAGALERSIFRNARLDIAKETPAPLAVDGNVFVTADPAAVYDRLWGNLTCRRLLAEKRLTRAYRETPLAPADQCVVRGDVAAAGGQWETALAAYKEALLQGRDRMIVEKALKMHKQLLETEGAAALEREIAFCRSAVMAFPRDVALLTHLAELHFQIGRPADGRTICQRVLELDRRNAYAKKRLEATAVAP